ncbi:MAG TPA: hypothetical protein VHX38_02365 [Pseudonocardiaceae bacterium]|nr:hypothetical protein [Pseudonocardiaceae bacterium]
MNADVMLTVAVLKVLSAHTKERYEQARDEALAELGQGDRRIVRSPLDGTKLGAVYMTDPKPVAAITDEKALTDWMSTTYPTRVESSYQIVGSDAEVIDILFQHAPRLLKRTTRLTTEARKELMTEAVRIGQPVGPGGEVDVPGVEVRQTEGYVACKPTEDALLSVYELVRSGRVALDGTVLPQLEASGD